MSEDLSAGYYLDPEGQRQRDRRKGDERRGQGAVGDASIERRRRNGRRKSDMEAVNREHQHMIDEALENFESGDAEETVE